MTGWICNMCLAAKHDGPCNEAKLSQIISRANEALGLDEAFEQAVADKFDECLAMLLSKHKDYGPKNISQSPGGALNGLRVRMHDKLARINHLLDSGKPPQNEALVDSFLDLANYAVIGMLVLNGQWPNE